MISTGFPGCSVVKNLPAMQGFDPWVGKSLWRRKWQPTPVGWKIPWTEEPGGLQSMGSQQKSDMT